MIATESAPTQPDIDIPMGDDQSKEKTGFRNYVASPFQNRVSRLYYENHKQQTFEFVMKQKERFFKFDRLEMSMWDAIARLNEIVDDSDPDTDYPQIMHLLQTSESIRKAYPGEEYDWFHLTGLIHDLGKILNHPTVFNEPQWAVVGDTYPVGCQFSDAVVFHEYFAENPDSSHPVYSTKFGVYHEGIGFDNVHFAWGHDEYMYNVCKHNKTTLPEEALYVIRYHSFYPWHNKGAYAHLASEYDKKMLFWVKEFQKHDLYSKLPEKPNIDALVPYYKKLIEKYFPAVMKW